MAALDRIAAANREPSPREAGCLFSALGAMASGAERSAEQWIARCQHADPPKQHAWNVPARLTVDGFRGALVELTRIGSINGCAEKSSDTVAARPQVYLRYDGGVGGGTDNHAVNLGVSFSW